MKKKWLIAVIAVYLMVRTNIAALSSYGFYHGWNEGYYSLIAMNYFSGSLWEQVAYPGVIFSSAPPFFSYAVYASFNLFGISDISARLVSILSEVIAVMGVYILARELYNEKTASLAAIIFIFIPWNILWFGRAQTDPLMTALMTLAIALYVRAYKNDKSMLPFGISLGLAVFTKQPALAALPIVLIWSYFQGINKKQILNAIMCLFAGLIPFLVWLSYYAVSGKFEVVFNIIFGELAYRSEPFSDLSRVITFSAAGISPLVIAAASYQMFRERNVKNILIIWLLIFGIFVILRTPPSHEYYSLPLMGPMAIMAGAGIISISQSLNKKSAMPLILLTIIISTIPVTYVILSYSGDAGYTATKDTGIFLKDYMDKNPDDDYLVLVQMKYSPQIAWYSGLGLSGKKQIYSTGEEVSFQYVEAILKKSGNKKVFLVNEPDSNYNEIMSNYVLLKNYNYYSNAIGLKQFNNSKGLSIFEIR